eukprot:11081008-Prorocentrum_lima.AAC.1
MDSMEKLCESLYDQLSDEEVFYYSDGPTLPPLQLNQVYSLTSTISEDAKQRNYRSHVEHDAYMSIKQMH